MSLEIQDWNNKTKRLLKSELIKRGISTEDLVKLFKNKNIKETKSSIDSKISRGTFSAAFFIQCLSVIDCHKIEIEDYNKNIGAEPNKNYEKSNNEK